MPPNEDTKIEVRLSVLETQVKRLVSDIESEKRTRAEVNKTLVDQLADINGHVRKLEMANWKAAGALAALIFLVQLFGVSLWQKPTQPEPNPAPYYSQKTELPSTTPPPPPTRSTPLLSPRDSSK